MRARRNVMDFLFITGTELDALRELPLNQRVVYLMGIRPYMDRKTFIVGIIRKISYQGLRETLYVAPIAGVKTGSPSHQQMKRAVKSLARAGLIEIRSSTKNLIVKCLLADPRTPEQLQNAANSTPAPVTTPIYRKPVAPIATADQARWAEPQHDSNKNHDELYQKFELFWQNYPLPAYKANAWEEFKKINPDDVLFEQIMQGLREQLKQPQQSKSNNSPTLLWPSPEDWLAKGCWQQ